MKFNVRETQEITDEERVQLAVVLDGGKKRPKRYATRDEIKAYAWKNGSLWKSDLAADFAAYDPPVAHPNPVRVEGGEPLPVGVMEGEEFPLGLSPVGEVYPEDNDLLGESDSSEDDLLGGDSDLLGEEPEDLL